MDEWIERARAGDRDALGALWRSHQHLLLRYFHGRGSTQPEDLASQVWIDVANSLHRFEGDGDAFRRWLFTIARRRHIDAARRQARRPEDVDADAVSASADESSARAFDAIGALDRAIALVRRLPPDMAEAVLLALSPTWRSTRSPASWVAVRDTSGYSSTEGCASSLTSSL